MRKHLASYVLASLALVLAACGGSPTAGNAGSSAPAATEAQKVYDQINGLSGEERSQDPARPRQEGRPAGAVHLQHRHGRRREGVRGQVRTGRRDATARTPRRCCSACCRSPAPSYQGADLIETNAGELNALQQQTAALPLRGRVARQGPARGPQGRLDRRSLQRVRGRLEHRQGPCRHRTAEP